MNFIYSTGIQIALLCTLPWVCRSQVSNTEAPVINERNPVDMTMELVNGRWFNGQGFEARTVWVRDGIIRFTPNPSSDTVIDLRNRYVIPPFAEAHNHNLESDYKLDERIHSYLDNGVFYVKMLSSIKKRIDPLMHNYNKPGGLDVSLAHAPLTATGGHPIELRKRFLENGLFDDLFTSLGEIESHGYHIIDDANDLDRKWDQILSFSPDFIKIMLLYSEEYDKRRDDTTYFGSKGLNPELVPKVVAKAHQRDLRVSAHVTTAHDFHVAVTSGVDEIAHLPGIHIGTTISPADARQARERNIVVVTTASLVKKDEKRTDYPDLVENVRTNLMLLKKEGVILAVGSDTYNDNSVGEFEFLYDLNLFSNLDLLKMWCENSAMTTFPKRKVGFLKEGYEASFLVLNKNPLEDIKNVNSLIELKVKQGIVLK